MNSDQALSIISEVIEAHGGADFWKQSTQPFRRRGSSFRQNTGLFCGRSTFAPTPTNLAPCLTISRSRGRPANCREMTPLLSETTMEDFLFRQIYHDFRVPEIVT